MAADGNANCNHEERDDNNGSCASLLSPQRTDTKTSSQLKQRKSERVAEVQIWRWKSHNGLASDQRHNKETKPGHNVSKRRAQNRAAQKAFRERQKQACRDLEVKNEELNISLGEALQEINRLRTLISSMSLERKTHADRTSPLRGTPAPPVCSAKCASQVQSARGPVTSSQCPIDKGKNKRSFEHVPNAPHIHIHTNACLFKSTGTTQHTVEFGSASNESVAAMKSAKRVCISAANSFCPSVPNHESLHANGQVRQGLVPDSASWLSMDATLSADHLHASAGLRSLSSSSIQGKEAFIRNLMNCSSCSLQQGYDCYNAESSNFAATPLIDEDTLDTPLTLPNPTRGILQFCADAQQFQSHSTNANDFPGQFQAAFEASAADSSDLTIPSFGLGELDWFEAPY